MSLLILAYGFYLLFYCILRYHNCGYFPTVTPLQKLKIANKPYYKQKAADGNAFLETSKVVSKENNWQINLLYVYNLQFTRNDQTGCP